MNSVKILHCADTHIGFAGTFLGENAEKRRFETLLTFEKIIDIAKINNVDFLLIAGDLFHANNVEKELIDRVFESFDKIPETKIIYVAGNHDPLNSESPFLKFSRPNLFVLGEDDECIEFAEKSTRVYGRSFIDASMQGEARFKIVPKNDDFINLMVMHGELKSDLNSQYNAITPEFVRTSGMDYIALGHVHKKSDVLKLDGVSFAYSGCHEGLGFDELDEKGVYLGEVSKGNVNLEFLPISKRQHILYEFDASNMTSSPEIAEKILLGLKDKYGVDYYENLYKIVIIGGIDEDVIISKAEIESRISNSVFFAKVIDNTEIKIDLEAIKNETSLKGIFVKNMLSLLENAENEAESKKIRDALNLGLRAFKTEVNFDEN